MGKRAGAASISRRLPAPETLHGSCRKQCVQAIFLVPLRNDGDVAENVALTWPGVRLRTAASRYVPGWYRGFESLPLHRRPQQSTRWCLLDASRSNRGKSPGSQAEVCGMPGAVQRLKIALLRSQIMLNFGVFAVPRTCTRTPMGGPLPFETHNIQCFQWSCVGGAEGNRTHTHNNGIAWQNGPKPRLIGRPQGRIGVQGTRKAASAGRPSSRCLMPKIRARLAVE